jgi:DNA-binding transcriptional MerR regulator
MLSITDVVRQSGIASSALRYYERLGLLRSTGRAGGKRTYSDDVFEQLAAIDLFQQCGFTLAEIVRILGPDGRVDSEWRTVARAKLDELEQRAAALERARVMLAHTTRCPREVLHECPTYRGFLRAHADAGAHEQGGTVRAR